MSFEEARPRIALCLFAMALACKPTPGEVAAPAEPAVAEAAPAGGDGASGASGASEASEAGGDEASEGGGAQGSTRPPVATEFALDGSKIVMPAPITFDAGGSTPNAGAEAGLYHLLDYLAAKESVTTVRIEGHAPEQALSEARALAVARWLVAHGASCSRVLPVGFGATKPIADGSTPEGRAANTRIEAVNAALRGRLIGGMPADGGGVVAGDPCS